MRMLKDKLNPGGSRKNFEWLVDGKNGLVDGDYCAPFSYYREGYYITGKAKNSNETGDFVLNRANRIDEIETLKDIAHSETYDNQEL